MKTKKSVFSPSSAPSSAAPAPHSVAHDIIAERAQAIWRERGSPLGRDMEIWLEAERQLYARRPAPRGAKGVRDAIESVADDFSPDPENALKGRVDKELEGFDE